MYETLSRRSSRIMLSSYDDDGVAGDDDGVADDDESDDAGDDDSAGDAVIDVDDDDTALMMTSCRSAVTAGARARRARRMGTGISDIADDIDELQLRTSVAWLQVERTRTYESRSGERRRRIRFARKSKRTSMSARSRRPRASQR